MFVQDPYDSNIQMGIDHPVKKKRLEHLKSQQIILNNPISYWRLLALTKALSHHQGKLQIRDTGTIFIVQTWNFQSLLPTQ